MRTCQTYYGSTCMSQIDPTLDSIREVLDGYIASLKDGEDMGDLVGSIFRCIPKDTFHADFLPTRGPGLFITFKPAFRYYMEFIAEYIAKEYCIKENTQDARA